MKVSQKKKTGSISDKTPCTCKAVNGKVIKCDKCSSTGRQEDLYERVITIST